MISRKNLSDVLRMWQKVYTFALAFGKNGHAADLKRAVL